MDTDLLCVILRLRCCVCGCRSAGVGPPFKTTSWCACVCVCVFTDAVATGSEGGERVLLGVRRRRLSPGSSCVKKPEPAVRPAACAPRPAPRPEETWWGRPAAVPGLVRSRDSGNGRGRRVPAAGGGGRAPSGGGRRAWPARPASWELGRCRHRRSGGTPRPPSRRPASGPAPGLCHRTCPGARGGAPAARPGRAPRGGGSSAPAAA